MRLQPGGGDTLAALIRQRGHTQAGAAAAAGCSASFMSKLCLGEKTSCSDDLAGRIADLLGVPTDILFMPAESSTGLRNVTMSGGVR